MEMKTLFGNFLKDTMKYVRVMLSWIFFFLGDLASKPLNWVDREWWVSFWYPIYNTLMIASVNIQKDDPRGPWGKPEN